MSICHLVRNHKSLFMIILNKFSANLGNNIQNLNIVLFFLRKFLLTAVTLPTECFMFKFSVKLLINNIYAYLEK